MDWYFSAPRWEEQHDCPNTSKLAGPKGTNQVRNKTVVSVKEARYRQAVFDGIFVLSDEAILKLGKKGKQRVEVYCCWFDHRLKTRGPKILVDLSKAEVINNYSGPVVSNLAR